MTSKPDTIATVDAGHGSINAAIYNLETNKQKSFERAAMRARVTGQEMGLGKDSEILIEWSEWGGRRFATGFDALTVRRDNLERHSGASRYGGEFHQHMIADALARMGIKSESKVSLTIFIPPGMYKDNKDAIQKRFPAGSEVTIQLKSDKKPRQWTYTDIEIMPECLIGAMVLALNPDGSVNKNNLLQQAVIIDLGMKTADAVEVISGKFNPDELHLTTFDTAGIRDQLLKPLLEDVQSTHRDFRGLTVDDMDMVVRSGLTIGQFSVEWAGQSLDIKQQFEYWRNSYAEFIANNIISERFRDLRDYQHAIFHGGGYNLIADLLAHWYGPKVFDPSKQPHTKKVRPLDWNREGGMRRALAKARKEGWIA
jgi:hypothetical protein